MGPAGYTLAHHLLNDGHAVVGVDGLKIEPLPADLTGVEADGTRRPPRLIRDVEELFEPLDARVMAGFGGVAEYGITVRWNKNYLKLIRLLLERRAGFSLHGGVRLGGTLTLDDAFDLGFDHVALAMGAGRPRYVDVPNGLARGVRQASDFLMGLQLTGAARRDSIANLQLRLPVLVIGGGLTAIDTATEALAYYPLQVEKFLARYETLCAERGQDAVRGAWDAEEQTIADEFIAHARAIRAERAAATAQARAPRILELLKSWGGATLVYRRRLVDAPCYTLNHEEVLKALEEGVEFAECLAPSAVQVDAHGHVSGLEVELQAPGEDGKLTATGQRQLMPARAMLVAAGTVPNTVLQREAPTGLALDGGYFRSLDENGEPQAAPRLAKSGEVPMLTQRRPDGRAVSFFGDLHPSFAGNVVKAMASAKRGYPVVSRLLGARAPASAETADAFQRRLHGLLRARVERVQRLTPTIVEVVVHAPLAAQRFEPGQFYRLQNFETLARRDDDTTLAMEGLALTGAWVDRERGLVALIVLEMGGSSDLCAHLTPGEPVVLMGPTGAPTEIPAGETVLLAGGGLGNAVLLSIGKALRAGRLARRLLCRLQARAGPLPRGRHRGRRRRRGLGLRPGARLHARPGAGPGLHRQHRAGHARLCGRGTGRGGDCLVGRRPHHRHRLGPHDGGRGRRPPRRAGAAPEDARRHRLHQLADAVHDERGLRAVPAGPPRSGQRPAAGAGVHLLQPGPAAGRGGLRLPRSAPAPERRAGKAHRAVDRPQPAPAGAALAPPPGRATTSDHRGPDSRRRDRAPPRPAAVIPRSAPPPASDHARRFSGLWRAAPTRNSCPAAPPPARP